MKDGTHTSIEYMASDDTKRTAKLTATDIHMPLGPLGAWKTDDCEWIVNNPDGTTPQVEWIFIRATDGSVRKVRIASQYEDIATAQGGVGVIRSDFVYAYDDGSDEHRERQIFLIDPQGKHYRLIIDDVYRPFPVVPTFTVDHP